jgi:hypothetical protein
MPRSDRRVSFLVAGVQKGGTSALFEYLREIPALQLPEVKEAHFFDDEEKADWSAPDYEPYHRLFVEDGRMWGEATPIYLYWPNALERVRAYNPDMKLILLFRDPVERAWSHWKMEYAKRKETEPFAWCIREGRARMAEGAPHPGFHRVFSYVERGFYGRQLARALRLFPSNQLLVLESARLSAEPDTVLAQICAFLGVPAPEAAIRPRRVRIAHEMTYPSELTNEDVDYLRDLYRTELARFHHLAERCNQNRIGAF